MSLKSPILCYVATFLVSPVFFPSTKAGPTPHDRDRAVLAFNFATDLCSKLNTSSHTEAVNAANWACWKAFEALDEIGGNTCSGWRRAGCRAITGYRHKQCSSLISTCSDNAIHSDVIRSFRECAVNLWIDEVFFGELAPSDKFGRASQRLDSHLENSRWVRSLCPIGSGGATYAGTSGAGTSGSGYPTGGTSSAGIPGIEISYGRAPQRGSSLQPRKGMLKRGSSRNKGLHIIPWSRTCETCGKEYKTKKSYGRHKAYHRKNATICTVCGKTLSTVSSCNKHLRKVHGQEPNLQSASSSKSKRETGSGGKRYGCDVCGLEYRSFYALRNHKASHEELLICKICKTRYKSKATFNTHIKCSHPGYEEVAPDMSTADIVQAYNDLNPYVCNYCGARYSREKSHRQHVISHTSTATTCVPCKYTFSTVSSYNLHLKTVHKQKSSSAPGPGETSTGSALYEAGRMSLPSTTHICEYCRKPYKSKKSYNQHVRSHITQATTCLHCSRLYSSRSNYNTHMKLVHKQGTTAGRGRAPRSTSTSEPGEPSV